MSFSYHFNGKEMQKSYITTIPQSIPKIFVCALECNCNLSNTAFSPSDLPHNMFTTLQSIWKKKKKKEKKATYKLKLRKLFHNVDSHSNVKILFFQSDA